MKLLRFERKGEPLASPRMFVGRLAIHIGSALLVVIVVLLVGMLFYHSLEPTASWHKAFHRASMILSGMGSVEVAQGEPSNVERVFTGLYALFAGLVLVTVIGLILTPVFHRVLHKFHVEDDDNDEKTAARPSRAKHEVRKVSKRKSGRKIA